MDPQWSRVRGFNYQPSWGSHGMQIWLDFKPEVYRREIEAGLRHFPGINTLRIWLSFDAYVFDRERCLANLREAAAILRQFRMKAVPVLFCGWHAIPDWGGFSFESLNASRHYGRWKNEREFALRTAEIFRPEDVLMLDLANEPFCSMGHDDERLLTRDFLAAVADCLHQHHPGHRITVGTWGMYDYGRESCWDSELLAPFIDVVSLHAYSYFFGGGTREGYLKLLDDTAAWLAGLGKPALVTEACGFAATHEERAEVIRFELEAFSRHGWGFLPHALHYSRVADLNYDGLFLPGVGGALHFIEADGSLRPEHGVYNQFC